MPYFSLTSKKRLGTCDVRLQSIFNKVIKHFDCTIIEGYRTEAKQNEYYKEGKSKVYYPYGAHNQWPSQAVDVSPYIQGISWNKYHCIYLAGFVQGISTEMGIKIRWGGDWDQDKEPITDQDFQDLVHYELIN